MLYTVIGFANIPAGQYYVVSACDVEASKTLEKQQFGLIPNDDITYYQQLNLLKNCRYKNDISDEISRLYENKKLIVLSKDKPVVDKNKVKLTEFVITKKVYSSTRKDKQLLFYIVKPIGAVALKYAKGFKELVALVEDTLKLNLQDSTEIKDITLEEFFTYDRHIRVIELDKFLELNTTITELAERNNCTKDEIIAKQNAVEIPVFNNIKHVKFNG